MAEGRGLYADLYESDEVRFFRQNKTLAQNIGIFCTLFCMGAWNGLERHYIISGALFGAISVAHNMLQWSAKRSPALSNWLQYPVVVFWDAC